MSVSNLTLYSLDIHFDLQKVGHSLANCHVISATFASDPSIHKEAGPLPFIEDSMRFPIEISSRLTCHTALS